MTATILDELSSRLLTSPSSDKVWEDDWEVAFRKLVYRCVTVPSPMIKTNDRPDVKHMIFYHLKHGDPPGLLPSKECMGVPACSALSNRKN